MNQKQLIRSRFRETVFRDNHKCCFCNIKTDLDAHHITDRDEMPNGGYVKENGITLCPDHHMMAEKYHITNGEEAEPGFHPDELYKIIKSSYEEAVTASQRLK